MLMSSTLARTGSPTGAHYAATKGGILGLARSLSAQRGALNIVFASVIVLVALYMLTRNLFAF